MRKAWDAIEFRSLENADYQYAASWNLLFTCTADLEKSRVEGKRFTFAFPLFPFSKSLSHGDIRCLGVADQRDRSIRVEQTSVDGGFYYTLMF